MIKVLAIQIVTGQPFPCTTSYEIASLPVNPAQPLVKDDAVSLGEAQPNIDATEKGLPWMAGVLFR